MLRRLSLPNDSDELKKIRRVPCRLRRLAHVLSWLLALVVAITLLQEVWLWNAFPSSCPEPTLVSEPCEESSLNVLLVVGKQVCAPGLSVPSSRGPEAAYHTP